MVNINPNRLQAKGLSPSDVLTALGNEQLILPGGTAKIGQFEYDVDVNADLKKVSEFNDLPIKRVGNNIIYLRDVATVSDGFAPQTNIVRQDGKRGALVTVLKAGDASTLDVVKGVCASCFQESLKPFHLNSGFSPLPINPSSCAEQSMG
jgi:multidrug efflux pump subunit AcrB